MRKNGGVLEHFLKSLLVAIFAAVVAFTPAHADDACKNLFDNNVYRAQLNSNKFVIITTNSTITSPYVSLNDFHGWGFVTTVEPNTTYTVQAKKSDDSAYTTLSLSCYENYDDITKYAKAITAANIRSSFTTPANCHYAVIGSWAAQRNTEFTWKDIQIERGDTATAYQPYNPLCATCQGIVKNYESATGTVVQNGTPTPTNPIEPTFYQQGDMILRKVGDVADSYDATTGKITRRVGYHVFNGAEAITLQQSHMFTYSADGKRHGVAGLPISTHFVKASSTGTYSVGNNQVGGSANTDNISVWIRMDSIDTIQDFKQFLLDQYAAGTPVTVYYPLKEASYYTEDWPSSYCQPSIKIATTAYNAARFNPVVTDLNSAVATIREIVTKTINQTAAIASLQADKQTRPEDACPAGKKCLLVETEEDGVIVPHWFPIIEAPENTE